MNVQLLDTDRYEVVNDQGVQVQQGAILPEWFSEAARKKRSVVDIIAAKLNVPAPAPTRTAEVKEKPGELILHEHPQYLIALPDHEHADKEHDHEHGHDEIGELDQKVDEQAIKTASDLRRLSLQLTEHNHHGFAAVDHGHADLVTEMEILGNRLKFIEVVDFSKVARHEHADLSAEIATLRNDLSALADRTTVKLNELRTVFLDEIAALREEMKQPHTHEYVPLDLFSEHLTTVGRRRNLQELSRQEVSGKLRLVVEEVE